MVALTKVIKFTIKTRLKKQIKYKWHAATGMNNFYSQEIDQVQCKTPMVKSCYSKAIVSWLF